MGRTVVRAHLRDFVKLHPEVEGVIQHVGLKNWDLLLIDVRGRWVRDEFETRQAAEEACNKLGIRRHDGWDDPRLARRMSSADHWNDPDGQRRAL